MSCPLGDYLIKGYPEPWSLLVPSLVKGAYLASGMRPRGHVRKRAREDTWVPVLSPVLDVHGGRRGTPQAL